MTTPFDAFDPVPFAGEGGGAALAYRHYHPDRMVLGRRMVDWLRPAVAYWHTLCWTGLDPFGQPTIDRPWHHGEPVQAAIAKAHAAFAFMQRLKMPFFCFHDRDVAPEAPTLRETLDNLDRVLAAIEKLMAETGMKLLWGTTNLFSHPRYMAGAATNPDPEVFAYAAATVAHMLEATHRLGGENYVLWGGREGYDTLLNTDMRRETGQLGRFVRLVVEHKHRIGFKGTILIEPKPMEPTKHQYDRDVATVYGFLRRFHLQDEVKVNIEVNHATLAGHDFEHEVALAAGLNILGSIDINRGDPRNGWDTDQFPINPQELAPAMLEIVRHGGLGQGGFNFDAKIRRQSIDLIDLFHAHIAGLDCLAAALLISERLVVDGALDRARAERYAAWDSGLGADILAGRCDMAALSAIVLDKGLEPRPRSGRQEALENLLLRAAVPDAAPK
jgi:xylose isomerase